MGTAQIKQELQSYINNGDSRLLKILYTVAKEYSEDDYTRPGKPMSADTLKSRIRTAKSRIQSGQYTTQKELEKEMDSW